MSYLNRESQENHTSLKLLPCLLSRFKLVAGELIRQLDYKASWYGRVLIQVDRFFPSSKRCHACGHVLDKLPLEVREWDCVCGSHNLRDYNNALNLLAVGRTVGEGGFNKPRSMHLN
ncbi:MAG: zinc ribbon domain-containing protein [Xenococcaceae cyanobacterium MO_234.B1]|nr:zinc ribbon domain-containing protein [Xenococcaceae cyanobacterium MO_234.B1]